MEHDWVHSVCDHRLSPLDKVIATANGAAFPPCSVILPVSRAAGRGVRPRNEAMGVIAIRNDAPPGVRDGGTQTASSKVNLSGFDRSD